MGRKPVKKVEAIETPATIKCLGCGKEQASSKYSDSQSILYRSIAKLPYCQSCKIDLYNKYVQEFTKKNYKNPEQKAVQRICMAFDLFYDDRIYQQALREYTKVINNTKRPASLISYYFKNRNLMQCKDDGSSYDASIFKEYDSVLEEERTMTVFHRKDEEKEQIVNKASEFFGEGFSDEDYLFLQKEYEDFKIKVPLVEVNGKDATAFIGLKEGLEKNTKFEVLERVYNEKSNTFRYKKVGNLKIDKTRVWENRDIIEGVSRSEPSVKPNPNVDRTYLQGANGSMAPGMLIRQTK